MPQTITTTKAASSRARPTLRFSPTAWAKLQYFCHRDPVEVGGFGVTRPDDLLRVEDFVTVQQDVALASIAFDDAAVADFFELQVDAGRRPEQFGRLWIHTHPGDSPMPSRTDEETFQRVFGACDWAVMFVLARSGATHARLRFNVGPGGEAVIPVEVDYSCAFAASDHGAWEAEYEAHVRPDLSWPAAERFGRTPKQGGYADEWEDFRREHDGAGLVPDDWLEEFSAMDPAEREFILDELDHQCQEW